MICDMIIKAIRFRSRSNVARLINHLQNGDDNEAISFLSGTSADLVDMHVDATRKGWKYSIRHWIISPHEATTRTQMREVVAMIANEFGFGAERAIIVEHKKHRATADACDTHWHVLVGEVDPVSGRVLKCSYDRIIHELLARFSEYKFGHRFVQGKHTKSVIAGLRQRGAVDAASSIDAELGNRERPAGEAFTHGQHQAKKRAGVDISAVRQAVKKAMATATTKAELTDLLSHSSLLALPGDKPGVWIVADQDGAFIGSLARLSGAKKSEIIKLMGEAKDEPARTNTDNGTGDLDGGARYSQPSGVERRRASPRPRDAHSDTRQNPGQPRTAIERDRAHQPKTQLASTEGQSAVDWLQGLNKYTEQLSSFLGTANLLAMSGEDRIIASLWEIETRARADLNREIPAFECSEKTNRLRRKAVELEKSTAQKWDRCFHAEQRLRKARRPQWWHYLVGVAFIFQRQQRRLASELQHASDELDVCKCKLDSVKTQLFRQESLDKQQHAALVEDIVRRKHTAGPMLEQVAVANNLVRRHPALAFCGLSFVLARARAAVEERKHMEADAERDLSNERSGYSR